MSEIDLKVIDHLEKLCRIQCTDQEKKDLLQRLRQVVDYIHLLDQIDTEHVAPCIRVQQSLQKNTLREDVVKDQLSKETFLKNSPAHIGGMIQVPSVIDKEERT